MTTRREAYMGGRHDPLARRKSQRHGKRKGVVITISAAELAACGIDPEGPPPEYRIYPGTKGDGGFQGRLFR